MKLPPLAPGKRMLTVGRTGCGKTVVNRAILKALRHVTVFDTKNTFSWKEPGNPYYGLIATNAEGVFKLWRAIEARGDGAPVIYRPNIAHPNWRHEADEIARVAFLRQHNTLYYDELADLVNATDYERVAPHWRRAIQQGRELELTVLMATQRPQRIPVIAGSEADVVISFYLKTKADRDRVEEWVGPVPWGALARTKHSFVIATEESQLSEDELRPHLLTLDSPRLEQRSA